MARAATWPSAMRAVGQAADEEGDLLGRQLVAVALGADDLLRQHRAASVAAGLAAAAVPAREASSRRAATEAPKRKVRRRGPARPQELVREQAGSPRRPHAVRMPPAALKPTRPPASSITASSRAAASSVAPTAALAGRGLEEVDARHDRGARGGGDQLRARQRAGLEDQLERGARAGRGAGRPRPARRPGRHRPPGWRRSGPPRRPRRPRRPPRPRSPRPWRPRCRRCPAGSWRPWPGGRAAGQHRPGSRRPRSA